jgi:hypothetical protein
VDEMADLLGYIAKAYVRGTKNEEGPTSAVTVKTPTEPKSVRISIYCAGTDTTKIPKDEALFKVEAEREVTWGLADIARPCRTIDSFYEVLEKDIYNSGNKIAYLSIYSHVTQFSLILDNGSPRYEAFTKKDSVPDPRYNTQYFEDFINAIKGNLLANALVVFAGCNAGDTYGGEVKNIAGYFTKQTGIASIGANGKTDVKNRDTRNIRTVSNQWRDNKLEHCEFLLFYKDVYAYMQQRHLGKELNQKTIENAINYINYLEMFKKFKNTP